MPGNTEWWPRDLEAALFAVKCLIAALLAFFVAVRIGLPRPYWAVATSFIVAQQFSGAVLAKALYRVLGTVLGGAAAVVLLPLLVNEPFVLSAALAVWLGICVHLALLDRTPRSYVFLLAGYTASIIAFPSVDTPDAILVTAVERMQEITIGILAGSLVHGALFPRTVTARLLQTLDTACAEARHRSKSALTGILHPEQARLTADLAEIDQLTIHLPFDTAPVVPGTSVVRALQDQLSLLLPLSATVCDRVRELRAGAAGLPEPIEALLLGVAQWLETTCGDAAEHLLEEATRLQSACAHGNSLWREMLTLNLLARLRELIRAHLECQRLYTRIKHPRWRDGLLDLLRPRTGRDLHLDPGLALRAAAGTATTVMVVSVFWIQTAWVDGAQATLMAGVCCALFGNVDRPTPALYQVLLGFVGGLLAAALYGFVILPRASDYITVAAALAPAFLLLAALLARPQLARVALGALVSFPNTVGLYLAYDSDFHTFINTAIAQLLGVGFATVMLSVYRTLDELASIARIRRACFRDIARRTDGDYDDAPRWLDKMLDRVNLLLACLPRGYDGLVQHAFMSLRIGYVGGELGLLGRAGSRAERSLIEAVLRGIAAHYRALDPLEPAAPAPALLANIDRTACCFAAEKSRERRRQGLVLLTSLRRNLFPAAPGLNA